MGQLTDVKNFLAGKLPYPCPECNAAKPPEKPKSKPNSWAEAFRRK